MKTKHTPGPWMVTESSDWGGMGGVSLGIDDAAGQDGARDYHLATVVHGDPDELQANARLIAAAPELLKASQFLLTIIERNAPKLMGMMEVDRARAAIVKATGGEV